MDAFEVGVGEISLDNRSFDQVSIAENTIGQVNALETSLIHHGSTQVGSNKTCPLKPDLGHYGLSQNSASQIGVAHSGIRQIDLTRIGTLEADLGQVGIHQDSFSQTSAFKIGTYQTNASHPRSIQIDTLQVGSVQTSDNFQVNSTEVSFSSSISLQQFL
ncbi:MAG: hypothetical protein WA902_09555, partial [Thermosynechococcaceae cyanobacterium]